jgi:hypothetical protein
MNPEHAELVEDIKAYLEVEPTGGSLHIVLEDLNLDDHSIVFCQGWAGAERDGAGSAIARRLEALTLEERVAVMSEVDGNDLSYILEER